MACAQDDGGAHCKLTVTLDLTRVGPDATTAKAISQAALQLGAQGIVTRVSIVDDPVVRTSLSRHIQSEDLNTLAPFLHKLELHPVPALSASTTGHEPFWCNVSLKYSALQQANQSLQALCLVHDFDIGIVRCIAQFGSLRKLHLTLEKSWPSDNCFAQLARLSQLRDLALQCQQCDVSCANVILSNQATLRSITLASCSWSLDTYAALNKASALTVLSVRVEVVTESDARILGNLKTPQSLRLELQRCDQMGWKALRALSSGQAKITFLSLCRMPRDQGLSYWKHVISMPYLTTLIIDAAMGFTGTSMQEQPCLSSLYLADCNDITEQGVAHMVDMFPALHTVLLCHGKKCFNSPFSHDRRVLQRSTFWRCHSGLSADSTSTNALSVRLATVVSYSSGLQVRCNILTNIILEEQTTKTFTCMPGARI